MQSLKIALITDTFPPEVNGVATTLWQIVSGLARRGHRVEVLRPNQKLREGSHPAQGWQEVLLAGFPIPVYRSLTVGLPAPHLLLRRWHGPSTRPDVVHVTTESPLGLSALWAASRLGIPISTSFNTNFHDYSRFYGYGVARQIVARYLRWFHNRAGCTLVPTEDLRCSLERLGYKRVGVIARGVDIGLFRPSRRDADLRRSWDARDGDLVAAFISRLAKEKNLRVLAAAFQKVRSIRPDARFIVVGDGPAREQLKELAPDAFYCGMKEGVDLATHYASADLFLFPSQTETFGNVVLEAMASGLPTVTFDYAASGLLVRHGVEGFKAPVGDERAYLAAVEEAASRPLFELREMGIRATDIAARQSWQDVVDRFEAALQAMQPSSS